ncbi:hypothetical protein QQF64_009855 [Cirrhinus molitorella]|uniref:Uncharacterized protein n=1 Tax=Cirrhinus molitorella TaxID=172907 RepID=A0ABR3M6F4_9TELE
MCLSVVSVVVVVVVLVIFPALAVLLPAVMLWVLYRKKADHKEEVVDPDMLTYVTYSGIPAGNMSKRIIYSFKNLPQRHKLTG